MKTTNLTIQTHIKNRDKLIYKEKQFLIKDNFIVYYRSEETVSYIKATITSR